MKHPITAPTALALCLASLISACGSGSTSPALTPGISVTPSTLAFGAQTVVMSSAAKVITVTNIGGAALSVTGVTVTGTQAANFVQSNTCASSVAPGATCKISVIFTPTAGGAASATITIDSNASTSPTTVAVSATLSVLNFSTFQPASVAIGAADLATLGAGTATATSLNPAISFPGVASNGTLYLPDYTNNRILGYHTVPVANGASADFVLGQSSLTGSTFGTTQGSLNRPSAVLIHNGQLLVSDAGNNRILIWNKFPTSTGALPDLVVGQPDFVTTTSGCSATNLGLPTGLAVVNGNLVVTDVLNYRVLIFRGIPAVSGAAAVGVLGQPDLATCTIPSSPTATNLNQPGEVISDGTHLLTTDFGFNRVLIWNTTDPTTLAPGQAADMVLGQADFTSSVQSTTATGLFHPIGAGFDAFSGRMAVADFSNNRVLLWNQVPTCTPAPCAITTPADVVLGQIDFASSVVDAIPVTGSSGTAPSANGMSGPVGVAFNGPNQLLIADRSDLRYLVHNAQ